MRGFQMAAIGVWVHRDHPSTMMNGREQMNLTFCPNNHES